MAKQSLPERLLLADIGNSRIKWNFNLPGAAGFATTTQSDFWNKASLEGWLDQHWLTYQASTSGNITRIIIANVAGAEVQHTVSHWCQRHFDITPEFVLTARQFNDVSNGYHNYAELGVDRWLSIIAAHSLAPTQPVIVVGCGSAITIDSVLTNGQHLAGPIIPGRNIMLDALTHNTALDVAKPPQFPTSSDVFVQGTQNAILSGVNFAVISAINYIVDAVTRHITQEASEHSPNPTIQLLVTGGAAQSLMPLTQYQQYRYEPDLVLTGLQIVAMGSA